MGTRSRASRILTKCSGRIDMSASATMTLLKRAWASPAASRAASLKAGITSDCVGTAMGLGSSRADEPSREDGGQADVRAGVGRLDDGVGAPRSGTHVHHDVVDRVVAVEVEVVEQVARAQLVERHVRQGRPLLFSGARHGESDLAPGPLDQARAVESDARSFA